MSGCSHTILEDRGVIAIDGQDADDFLQGLISNDVTKLTGHKALHSALLTPQGKYLHDFFMARLDGRILLDCEAGRLEDLLKRLKMYKLRSKVTLTDCSGDFTVAALMGDGWADAVGLKDSAGPCLGGVAFTDPRHGDMGGRAILPREGAAATLENAGLKAAALDDYHVRRLSLGLPDGSRDMVVEKAILLENGFDELGSIDWDKGCYMGQELTARTKYRGLIKKRLVPVEIEGPEPEPGTPVMAGGKEVGETRSSAKGMGLALLRLEYLDAGGPFTAGEATLTPKKPAWAS